MTDDPKLDDLGGLRLPKGEAALVTTDGGKRLSLYMPDMPLKTVVPPKMLFLAACLVRGEKEPGFVEEQLDWMEKHRQ